jgi:hypothetical protein
VTVAVPDTVEGKSYTVTINGETLPLTFVDGQYQITVLVEGTPGETLNADLNGGAFGDDAYRVSTTFPDQCNTPNPVTTTSLPTSVQGTQLPKNFQPAGVQSGDIPSLARTGFASAWVLAGLALVFLGSTLLLIPSGTGLMLIGGRRARRTGVDKYGRRIGVRRDITKAIEADIKRRNAYKKSR